MPGIPEWVSEGSVRKYHRALAHFTVENAKRRATNQPLIEVTDALLKEHYVKNAGLVLGEPETTQGVEPGDEGEKEKRAEDAQGKSVSKKK